MKISGRAYRTIWPRDPRESGDVEIIDQTKLPHRLETQMLETLADAAHAIKTMVVRGAPLIGATAAYGMALAAREDSSDSHLTESARTLQGTRPTAVNLAWAIKRMRNALQAVTPQDRVDIAFR